MELVEPENSVAYYTVADSAFFVGVVALLNSLRYVGEEAPLFVVDCGLTEPQRTRLSQHATIIPRHPTLHPQLQKATGPLARPAEIMVVLDADIIVAQALTPLLREAERDRVVVFQDEFLRDRYFDEWSALGLGVQRREPYVNSGFLVLPFGIASRLLPTFVDRQERLDPAQAAFGGAKITEPFYFPDQDILNAILAAQYGGRVTRLPHRLAPVAPFDDLVVRYPALPACTYPDGTAPYILHHILDKPWLAPIDANAYSELLTKLVTRPDAPVRLGRRDLPLRLSDSRFAPVDRWRVWTQLTARRRLRGKLGVRPALERRIDTFRKRRLGERASR